MPAASSYIDVAAALKSQLETALPDIQVMRGVKLDRLQSAFIAIGGIEDGNHTIPTMRAGRKRRQEEYKLIINLVATRKGPDPVEAETKVFELFDTLEDILAEDPALGIGTTPDYVGLVCVMNDFDLDSVYDQERSGWRAMIVAKVLVTVRLQ